MLMASVVSAGFYLPVVMVMYMKPAASDDVHGSTNLVGPARLVVTFATVLLLLFGVWPNRAMDLARNGADGLQPAPTQVFTD